MGLSFFFILLSTLMFLGGMGFVLWIERHHDLGAPIALAEPAADGPLISILIPARNEARNIRRCLEGVRAQTYSRWEAVVIDDNSADDTPQIVASFAARDSRIRLVRGTPLPARWVGKSHALAQGAQAAKGEWLCMLDADTFAAPELLASTYQEAQTRGVHFPA
ncbi:MAG: glycosyltransferase family 2 protein [Anaerolineales bacterium]|nr:glycosyltransferase family 2 protein [Anaerolineales bacterium]